MTVTGKVAAETPADSLMVMGRFMEPKEADNTRKKEKNDNCARMVLNVLKRRKKDKITVEMKPHSKT
jgi:hypothetical protein